MYSKLFIFIYYIYIFKEYNFLSRDFFVVQFIDSQVAVESIITQARVYTKNHILCL